jgi:arabinofuranosyltransferase
LRRLLPLHLLVWLIVGAFVVTHAFALYDDAYIYFRFVENVYAGCGVRWNCGDARVEGFTSPLYFVLLLTTRVFSSDLESSSQVLGLLAVGTTLSIAIALAARARREAPVLPAALIALLALDGYFLLNATIGLETGLACVAVLAVLAAALAERGLGAAIVVAVLVRPELGVLALALPLVGRRRDFAIVGIGAVVIVAARWMLFADLLPNTFWAKTGGTRAHLSLGVAYVLEIVADFPLIVAAPLAQRLEGWRRPTRFVIVAAGLQLAFFLYSGGDTFLYSRLFMPFVPALHVLAVAGVVASGRRLVIGLFVIAMLFGAARHYMPPQHAFQNVAQWETIGRWLRQNKPATTKIAIVPIGAVGYFSRLPMIDLVGLATREVARGERVPPELLNRAWIGHEKHNTEWVLAQRPDLIVFATKWRSTPWVLEEARAGFWAEKQILDAIKMRGGYRVANARIERDVYWLMFERVD